MNKIKAAEALKSLEVQLKGGPGSGPRPRGGSITQKYGTGKHDSYEPKEPPLDDFSASVSEIRGVLGKYEGSGWYHNSKKQELHLVQSQSGSEKRVRVFLTDRMTDDNKPYSSSQLSEMFKESGLPVFDVDY